MRYLDLQEARMQEYEDLLTGNPIFRARLEGVGAISGEEAVSFGLSGPCVRASGVPFDVRKDDPYDAYAEMEFNIAVAAGGDCFARYQVRLGEMRESLRIIRQCLARRADGDVLAKVPRTIKPPAGDAYARVDAPRGDFGVYVVSDGSATPSRVHFRSPSFINVSALNRLCRGMKLADVVAILGSIDIILGEVDR